MSADKKKLLRCAIYTRVSTDAGLEQDFNSLDAQRESCEAYIKSQSHEGWKLLPKHYDDGGISGDFLEWMAGAVRRCDVMVLLMSPEYEKSSNCKA